MMPAKHAALSASAAGGRRTSLGRGLRRSFWLVVGTLLILLVSRRSWAVITVVLGSFILYACTRGTGIPERSKLATASGTVRWVDRGEYVISFRLTGHDRGFEYASKGRAVGRVRRALQGSGPAEATVLFNPHRSSGPVSSDERFHPVYELSVGGVAVRTYDEVQAAWRADNRIGFWLGVAFLVCSALMAFTRSGAGGNSDDGDD